METTKFVWFDKWCNSCRYRDQNENESPCNECLTVPARENSTKPIKYFENARDDKKTRK